MNDTSIKWIALPIAVVICVLPQPLWAQDSTLQMPGVIRQVDSLDLRLTTSETAYAQIGFPDTISVRMVREEGWSAQDVTGAIAALTALVAVIVGTLSGYHIAMRQMRATTVSTNRQAWINDLRDRLAELSTVLYDLASSHDSNSMPEYRSALGRVSFLRSKIALMINPLEQDHAKLLATIDTAISIAAAGGEDLARFNQVRAEIVSQAQAILKREWEVVKAGR